MDPQQQRRHFLYTTRNTPPQGPLLGSPGGGACQRGFLEPQKEYSWLSSGVDPWYMCTRCPNKGEIMVDGQEPRARTQGTQVPVATVLVTYCRTLSKVLGLHFISWPVGELVSIRGVPDLGTLEPQVIAQSGQWRLHPWKVTTLPRACTILQMLLQG